MSLNLTAEEIKGAVSFIDRASYKGLAEAQFALQIVQKLMAELQPRPVPNLPDAPPVLEAAPSASA